MGKPLELELVRGAGVWASLRDEAESAARAEPTLAGLVHQSLLSHDDLASALAFQLGRKLGGAELEAMSVSDIARDVFDDPELTAAAAQDLQAVFERDPATKGYLQPFLFFKGFQALQAHRVAHRLWSEGRDTLAFWFQSRSSQLFQVDIHPAARFGRGVFVDHATGVVVGETAVVGDDVSMLHAVTLGGTGAQRGDRHPKIGKGVLLGAGAKVLGNISVGDYAKVASGSVVLKPVPAGCTVAGVPARLVNCPTETEPYRTMDHTLAEAVYDYVI